MSTRQVRWRRRAALIGRHRHERPSSRRLSDRLEGFHEEIEHQSAAPGDALARGPVGARGKGCTRRRPIAASSRHTPPGLATSSGATLQPEALTDLLQERGDEDNIYLSEYMIDNCDNS